MTIERRMYKTKEQITVLKDHLGTDRFSKDQI